ncbi:MAG: amidophosphoribosyltransferase [Bacteriovoracia bacterium]
MCGVVGLIGSPEAAREAFLSLTTLQHRGQDAAGILTYDESGFHRVKNTGLVENVFTRENIDSLTGSMAVGHARYATIGKGDLVDVQPFLINFPFGIGLVHNGNLVNYEQLAAELKTKRRHLLTHSDSEVLMNMLADGIAEAGTGNIFEDICKSLNTIMTRVNGSYSVLTLIAEHGLLAFRDPYGIRPLVWGRRRARRAYPNADRESSLPTGESHMIASESVALNFNGYEIVKNLEPGEVLFIDLQGQVHSRVLRPPALKPGARHCMFEWVYFASPESVIDQVPVYASRIQLGKGLAKLIKQQIDSGRIAPDMVVPVPETSRIAAIALAEELGLPYRETLIKNRYIKRTFILDSDEKRRRAVNLKLSPVRSEIEGKSILLVDDSIVRGTTSRKLIELVRGSGARKVYFVSTCPPIQNPCYYGIDFPSNEELIAYNRTVDQVERELGADAVIYLDHQGLRDAIKAAGNGVYANKPCMACLDGDYPSDISEGRRFGTARSEDRKAAKTAGEKAGKGGAA